MRRMIRDDAGASSNLVSCSVASAIIPLPLMRRMWACAMMNCFARCVVTRERRCRHGDLVELQSAGPVGDEDAASHVTGVRVIHLPRGARAVHTFWFAWAAFHPETEIFGESQEPGAKSQE